jgi:hypothetical protein
MLRPARTAFDTRAVPRKASLNGIPLLCANTSFAPVRRTDVVHSRLWTI